VTVTERARSKDGASVRGRVEGGVVGGSRGRGHGVVVLEGGVDYRLRLSHEEEVVICARSDSDLCQTDAATCG
jgi:hypothetical protein